MKAKHIVLLIITVLSLGLGAFGISRLKFESKKEDVCTQKIQAKCIDIRKSYGNEYRPSRPDKHVTYQPTFQYSYKDTVYKQVSLIRSTDKTEYQVGNYYTLYINPKKPSEFYVQGEETEIAPFAIIAPIMGFLTAIICFTLILYDIAIRRSKN